jgi:hypothetical protein
MAQLQSLLVGAALRVLNSRMPAIHVEVIEFIPAINRANVINVRRQALSRPVILAGEGWYVYVRLPVVASNRVQAILEARSILVVLDRLSELLFDGAPLIWLLAEEATVLSARRTLGPYQ